MRILIVSDSHRKDENLEIVLGTIGPIDMLIHLGDVEGSEEHIRDIAECPCHIVAGNNDYFSTLSKEIKTEIGKYSVMLTHGHNYYVSLGYETIISEAKAQNIDIVMFGHTHRPVIEKRDGVQLINPGSIAYPRQENRQPSYIIMEIDEKGEASYNLEYV